ncbi:MAG: radical SAM protein [Candidatus Sumerlaeaceae bacterium]|nr:radical SAM protein [Candidatus Sumerlaeaceae bacterium]
MNNQVLLLRKLLAKTSTLKINRTAMRVSLIYCDVGAPWRHASMLDVGILHQMLADARHEVTSACCSWYDEASVPVGALAQDEIGVILAYLDEFNWHASMAVFTRLRAKHPRAKFIALGPYATLAPENVLRSNIFDLLIAGEPYSALFELITVLEKNEGLSRVRNLWWRKPNGELVRNPLRPLIDNLDVLPLPNRSLLEDDWDRFPDEKTLYLRASVGCAHDCIFCFVPILRRAYTGKGDWNRVRAAAHVVGELLAELRRESYSRVVFTDEIFPTSKVWLRTFVQHLRGIALPPWEATVAVEHADREVLELLKMAGCSRLHLGLEAGNESFRKRLATRNTSAADVTNFCNTATELGISIVAHIMVGLPLESAPLAEETITFLHNLKLHRVQWHLFWPIDKTPLGEHCRPKTHAFAGNVQQPPRRYPSLHFSEMQDEELRSTLDRLTFLNMTKLTPTLPPTPSHASTDLLSLLPHGELSWDNWGLVNITDYLSPDGVRGVIVLWPQARVLFPALSLPPGSVLRMNVGLPKRTERYLAAKGGGVRLEIACISDGRHVVLFEMRLEARDISSNRWRELLVPIPEEITTGRLSFLAEASVSDPDEITVWLAEPLVIQESVLLKSREAEQQLRVSLLADLEVFKKRIQELEQEVLQSRQREHELSEECSRKARRIGELQIKILELEKHCEALETAIRQQSETPSLTKLIKKWMRWTR